MPAKKGASASRRPRNSPATAPAAIERVSRRNPSPLRHEVQPAKTRSARRNDWKTSSLPKERSKLLFDRQLTAAEFDRIARGLIPEQMEDKWFVFLEGDALYLHRSWTGLCIYVVHLARRRDGIHVVGADVNRSPSQYTGGNDADEAAHLCWLIEGLLLQNWRADALRRPGAMLRDWGWKPQPATRDAGRKDR